MSKYVVTGCAGFIGSNLTDRLLSLGHSVIGIDNFSTGQKNFLSRAFLDPRFKLFELDLLDFESLVTIFQDKEIDAIFHLAANADVRFGTNHPRKDLEQNTIVTFNVLESMRLNNIKKIIFSSTGSVYGESKIIPTPEDGPFPVQTSLYGASKVACEGLISSYCEGFGFKSWIFRFVSILGERYTHGHIFDFYLKLKQNSRTLNVLGNGKQKKSYLYVRDCINAILLAFAETNESVNIFNLGADEFCEINDSVKWICGNLNVSPNLVYSGGDRGWIGDNPFIYLDTKKIRLLGWKSELTIQEGVLKTLDWLKQNEWIFNERY
jgi:UDP-glucose 4-epimerase